MSSAGEEAKRYLNERDISTLFECLMTGLMYNKPTDHVQFMIECLMTLKQDPTAKITWNTFVEKPPPPMSLKALMNGHATATQPGSERRPRSSAAKKGGGSKERRKVEAKQEKSVEQPNAAEATDKGASVAANQANANRLSMEDRLSTPLLKEAEHKLSKDLILILLFGGPGGARSEHCRKMAENFKNEGLVAVSMPELVHNAFNKYEGRFPEWREAKAMYDRGELLPDRISLALLKQDLSSKSKAKYAILDGFPRNIEQIQHLEENGGNVKLAIILDFDEETLFDQIKRRGHGSAIAQKRLQEFKEKTLPVAKYYDDRFLLHLVPGEQDDGAIQQDMQTLIEKLMKGELTPSPATHYPNSVNGGTTKAENIEAPILLVVGAPGSLKRDYCKRIVKRYDGFVHISLGEMIWAKLDGINSGQDEKWKEAKKAYDNGHMIDNSICSDLIVNAMEANAGIWGYVIDGYPRDMDQARIFQLEVGRVDLVLLIDCTESFCLRNMEIRGTETSSARDINARTDNMESASVTKLSNFKEKTLPMLKHFDEEGKLRVVEGDRGVDSVIEDVFSILDTALFIPHDTGSGKSLN